jgi:TP901 family phage tail tape measure protein
MAALQQSTHAAARSLATLGRIAGDIGKQISAAAAAARPAAVVFDSLARSMGAAATAARSASRSLNSAATATQRLSTAGFVAGKHITAGVTAPLTAAATAGQAAAAAINNVNAATRSGRAAGSNPVARAMAAASASAARADVARRGPSAAPMMGGAASIMTQAAFNAAAAKAAASDPVARSMASAAAAAARADVARRGPAAPPTLGTNTSVMTAQAAAPLIAAQNKAAAAATRGDPVARAMASAAAAAAKADVARGGPPAAPTAGGPGAIMTAPAFGAAQAAAARQAAAGPVGRAMAAAAAAAGKANAAAPPPVGGPPAGARPPGGGQPPRAHWDQGRSSYPIMRAPTPPAAHAPMPAVARLARTAMPQLATNVTAPAAGPGGAFAMTKQAQNSFQTMVRHSKTAGQQINKNLKDSMSGVAHHMAAQATHAGYVLTHAISKPLMDIGREATHLAVSFELTMSRIQGLTTTPKAQVDQFAESIKGLAPALGSTPEDMAKAMYFITSGGLRANKAMDALAITTKASVAGLGEVKDVAFAAKAAVNAYTKQNMTAAHATDVLTATVIEGKLQADQLAPVMGRILPIASAMGMSFEDVGGSMAALTRVGASAAQASVGIQAMLMTLAKPSEAAREMIEGAGLSFQQLRDMAKDGKGLISVLRLIDDTFGDDEEAIARIVPNIRALRAALGLLAQDGTIVDEVMNNVKNSAGATEKAFAVAAGTNSVKYQMAMANVKVALIEVGQAIADLLIPMFQQLAGWVRIAGDYFASLSPQMKQAVVIAGMLGAALAPAVFALATVSALASFLMPVLAGLASAVTGVGAAFFGVVASILSLKALIVGIPAIIVGLPVVLLAAAKAAILFAAGAALIAAPLLAAGALVTGLMNNEKMGGIKRLGVVMMNAWAWLAPTRRALLDLWYAVYDVGVAAWGRLEKFMVGVWERVFGKVDWNDMQRGFVIALRAMEYGLQNLTEVFEATAVSGRYYFVAMGNELVHLFTRTLPYAAGYGLGQMGKMIEEAAVWFQAQFKYMGVAAVAGLAVDWTAAFDSKKAGGLGKAMAAAKKEAETVGATFNKGLGEGMAGEDFKIPLRARGLNERELEEEMRRKWGGLKEGFDKFSFDKDARHYMEALEQIQTEVAHIMDVSRWLTGTDVDKLYDEGEKGGNQFKKGLEKGMSGADAAFRNSAQHAVRWAEYAENTLRPIEQDKLRRQRQMIEAQNEVVRTGRIGTHQIAGALQQGLMESLLAGYMPAGQAKVQGGPPPIIVRGGGQPDEKGGPGPQDIVNFNAVKQAGPAGQMAEAKAAAEAFLAEMARQNFTPEQIDQTRGKMDVMAGQLQEPGRPAGNALDAASRRGPESVADAPLGRVVEILLRIAEATEEQARKDAKIDVRPAGIKR